MRSATPAPARRYPLHVTLSVAFTSLLVVLGGSLILFGYLESRRIALIEAEQTLLRARRHVEDRVQHLYAPAQHLVDLSARAFPAVGVRPADRSVWIAYMAESLKLAPRVSAIFVGYPDGRFLMVRRAGAWTDRPSLPAPPPEARYVAQRIDHDETGEPREWWTYYDADLVALASRERVPDGFDPRRREWYVEALAAEGQFVSEPYRFRTTSETGVTIARALHGNDGVVGVDLVLDELAAGLDEQRLTESSRLVLLGHAGGVIASTGSAGALPDDATAGPVRMPRLGELDDPVYRALAGRLADAASPETTLLEIDGRAWLVSLSTLPVRDSRSVLLAQLVPRDELLAGVTRVRDRGFLLSIGLLLVALAIVLRLSRHVSGSLRRLAQAAGRIRQLRLDTPLAVRSRVREVDELAGTMVEMKSALEQFLAISQSLSAEKDFGRLLDRILTEARRVTRARGGAILLRPDGEPRLHVAILHDPHTGERRDATDSDEERRGAVTLDDPESSDTDADGRAALAGEVVRIDDLERETRFRVDALRHRYERHGGGVRSVLSVPLRTQQEEIIGVLQLVDATAGDGRVVGFAPETVPYMEALSSSATVALDNRRLLMAQRDLLQAFIHVVAGAIDAKSPYTHGHCQRVPVLARMLAEAAHGTSEGPLAGFRLDDDEWDALHLASWLHDCGKVTTPEHVVDKATRLETIHNRIHEVRTRFEVLWRDAEIAYLRARIEGAVERAELEDRLERRRRQLQDDFAFVARLNVGREPANETTDRRLRRIAAERWLRHFDDRLGLSHGELERLDGVDRPDLPVEEPLLADRPEHVVPRPDDGQSLTLDPHGFCMEVPDHLYNHGELHNLRVARGTLTEEERFKINEHIVETIRMLGQLPFPRELERVPEWAGNHHERMDGRGYPRRLTGHELSIPARIMAIADIFEALTAADRPYMEPKPLGRALRIMAGMRDEGHICPDLFELFVRSGIYRRYARNHLKPEQIDDVTVEELLAAPQPAH